MLRWPHSSSSLEATASARGSPAVFAGAGGATGAFGRAGAAAARFCDSAYFASRIARRLSILLIDPSHPRTYAVAPTAPPPPPSATPVDRVVHGLQPGTAGGVVLGDPGDTAPQVGLERTHVVAVLGARFRGGDSCGGWHAAGRPRGARPAAPR